MIKNINNLHSFKEWLFIFFLLAIATFLLPLLNIFAPEESVLHVPDYIFPLLGKYLCYALVALAIDLGLYRYPQFRAWSFLLYGRICYGHVSDEEYWKRRCL